VRHVRVHGYGDGISVQAIVGTHVVLFGFDVAEERVPDLVGFAIKKTDKGAKKTYYLDNFLLLEANDRGKKSNHSSYRNPFQEFVWGDYTLRPGRKYHYEVTAMYGKAGHLKRGSHASVEVETESETDGVHAVFFNRGVAGSQAYARKFHNQAPKQAGPGAFAWLSRGLAEAMDAFIARARGPKLGLRAAVYEFTWPAVLDGFAAAAASGADVKIVFDAIDNHTKDQPIPYPRDANRAAIANAGLNGCIERTTPKIAHNKFIVLLEDGTPTEVWTGSTNITEGALYGQWNVGHIVHDPTVARRYLDYWTELSGNPSRAETRIWDGKATPVPKEPAAGVGSIFSPRQGLGALKWYAQLANRAENTSVFLTGAFGISKELAAVFEEKKDYLRYLLLDKRTGKVTTIARNPSNEVTAGGYLGEKNRPWSNWLIEHLTELNPHVQYVHTKFMLLNPLGDDPVVIIGSANFSEPSTTDNDENMLVIRGDPRVADIYLGEFMRLFTHFRFRGKTRAPNHQPAPGPANPTPAKPGKLYLRDDDSWARRFYVKGSPREKERLLFRAPPQ
jgi:phosphatidylserine/phosphatidylglycerophosphate/cardiolipin synthase-like enzyme